MFKVAKKDEEEEEDKVQALVDQLKSKGFFLIFIIYKRII